MALKKKKKDSLSFISKIQLLCINPVTPTSDQDRISPHSINTIPTRQVMRITKNINKLKGFKLYIPVNIGLNEINYHSMTEA